MEKGESESGKRKERVKREKRVKKCKIGEGRREGKKKRRRSKRGGEENRAGRGGRRNFPARLWHGEEGACEKGKSHTIPAKYLGFGHQTLVRSSRPLSSSF